jgi:hypothetical protein
MLLENNLLVNTLELSMDQENTKNFETKEREDVVMDMK